MLRSGRRVGVLGATVLRAPAALLAAAVLMSAAPAGAMPAPAAVQPAAAADCTSSHPTGDVNGDGSADAVIADPGATVNGRRGSGVVQVRYGAAKKKPGIATLHAGLKGVGGTAAAGAAFGSSVAVGYLNSDTCADVVVGAPGVDSGATADTGAAYVIFGSPAGLGRGQAGQELRIGAGPISGTPRAGDRFGASVGASDIYADTRYPSSQTRVVAVGAPGRDAGTVPDAGAAYAISIASSGKPAAAHAVTESSSGVPGKAGAGDHFGASVVVGPIRGACSTDTCLDLAVGVPGKSHGAGAVTVVVDPAAGSPYTGSVTVSEASAGVAGTPRPGDGFGSSLDYRTDGITGVGFFAVGVPGKDVGRATHAGAVNLFELDTYTSPLHAILVRQGGSGVLGAAETGDRFGATVMLTQYQSDFSMMSLVVGVPGEDLGRVANAGAVQTFDVRQSSLSVRQKVLDRASPGVPGAPHAGDRFGTTLGVVGYGALLVGIPGDDASRGGGVVALPWFTVDRISITAGQALHRTGATRYGAALGRSV